MAQAKSAMPLGLWDKEPLRNMAKREANGTGPGAHEPSQIKQGGTPTLLPPPVLCHGLAWLVANTQVVSIGAHLGRTVRLEVPLLAEEPTSGTGG